ncbi:MAG: starch-binding protein, partial [Phycisphaerales bacterium]|nr:starch-binding protein [Phycisphaerales bacterium]
MTDLIIYFHKPEDWADTVHLHYWDTQPGGRASKWPGARMVPQEDDWFAYRLDGVSAISLVFNDDQGHQTSNLWREGSGYYQDGQWFDEKPIPPKKATVSSKRTAASSAKAQVAPVVILPTPAQRERKDGLSDFREETIYFLLTTRFYDGDPSNNFFCRDRIKFNPETGKAEDPHWRGDFKGLIQKLDYIRDLGFTAIWITPPVENRSGLDYHGYHAYDWTRIDPRLESPDATYQDLIDEAHKRGIKIIQDVVVNHSCQYGIRGKVHIDHLPIKYYVPQGSEQGQVNHGPYQGNLGNYAWPNRDDIDNPVAPDWYRERHDKDPEGKIPLVDPKTGETVPKSGYNPGRFFGIDANQLDPEWYMQHGFICGGDWESEAVQLKHIAGDCINLATDRQ